MTDYYIYLSLSKDLKNDCYTYYDDKKTAAWKHGFIFGPKFTLSKDSFDSCGRSGAGWLMKLIFRALYPPGETKSSKQQ